MNLIFLSLLFTGIASVKGQCEAQDNRYPEGCYTVPNQEKIKCKTGGACECTDPSSSTCTDLGDVLGTAEEMNSDKCSELCTAAQDCKFFRWEETYGLVSCSLMNGDQCDSYEPCSGDHCLSGQAGCPTGDGPIGPNCTAGAIFHHDRIHWNCINPFGDTQTHIDIYYKDGPRAIIPQGTICYTERKCWEFDEPITADFPEDLVSDPDFLYHTYVVQCIEDSGAAKWEKFPQSTNNPDGSTSGGQVLEDPECNFDPKQALELDTGVLTESGVSFICSDGTKLQWSETVVTVQAPNTCALLCNFHHAMTIEPKFQEDSGESKWWKYSTVDGEDMEEEATKDNVFCWEPPTPTPTTGPTTTTL